MTLAKASDTATKDSFSERARGATSYFSIVILVGIGKEEHRYTNHHPA